MEHLRRGYLGGEPVSTNGIFLCVCLFLGSSPEMSPLKSVPQIRIDMDPDDDNSFYWKSRGSETSL